MRKRSAVPGEQVPKATTEDVAKAFGHGRPRAPEQPETKNEETERRLSVEETSAQLNDELQKNMPKTRIEEAFEHRNRRGTADKSEADLEPDFEKIVETLIIEHPFDEYQKLESALKVGDKRTDYHSLMQSLDEAETNARRAHKLMTTAKLERDRWERENAVTFAGMREEAHKTLQREKDQKLRNKQITDADVEHMCAVLFPDEWRSQENKRKRVEQMAKSMENLCEMWVSRCKSLQGMLAKLR